MRKLLLFFFLLPTLTGFAQNLDSLYADFLRIKGETQMINQPQAEINEQPIKCAFGIVNQVWMNYANYPLDKRNVLKSLLDRPQTDTSIVTPSGHFRIHFFKTGSSAPGYSLSELAKAADSSYNYEVNILGFPPPPKDNKAGGDDRYDIYILSLANGLYGYTQFDSTLTNDRYTCYTVMDNDFGTGYNTHGIDAARVTVAHEFHHAIQVGNYIYRGSDNFYYELTSTSMEHFVYPSIRDYVYYIPTYFRNTQRAFASNDGYNIAIWHLYLSDRFGINIIKNIWELMPQRRALECFSDVIQNAGSSFRVEFNQFGIWTYFTGIRTITNKYFKDAAYYPLINPALITNPITTNSEAVSNNFYKLYDNLTSKRDSVIALVSNTDVAGGISTPSAILPFTYTLSTQPISGGNKIADKFYSKLESSNNLLLAESNVLSGSITIAGLNYAYPQPFKYSLYNALNFPVAANGERTAELYIYSIDMSLVYYGVINIVGNEIIPWNCLDSSGKKLGTGVYIFVTKAGDNIKKGKFVIHND